MRSSAKDARLALRLAGTIHRRPASWVRSPILGFVGAVRSPKTGLAGNRKPGLGDLTGCGREQMGVVGRKGECERNRKRQKGQEKEKTPAGTEAFSGKISIQSPGKGDHSI